VLNFLDKREGKTNIKQIDDSESRREGETQMVGKNQVAIPVLNLPSKNSVRVTIEEEQVEQVKINISEREEVIRNLKSTKIELP
jgi:hypothetical protein